MRSRLTILVLALLLIAARPATQTPPQPRITQNWADTDFGETITFFSELESDVPVEQAIIFFQAANDTRTNVGLAKIESIGEGIYQLSYTHPISDYRIRPFSNIGYRFEVMLEGGQVYKSPSYEYHYEDNRFDWNTLEEQPFRVHWFEGDTAFAQSVLDAAQSGMKEIENYLSFPSGWELDIYVYPEGETMQAVLHPSSGEWVAGHADPDLGVIVVALPEGPEQRLLVEQRIPHELMHIVLYHITGRGYTDLPTWLNEGLASSVELYPNPDYRILLDNAVEEDSLLPMSSLCKTFPRDANGALLSYAQSASFTRYLHHTYGISEMEELITAYANGLDCEQGTKVALGKGLTQLENAWQRDVLAEDVTLTAVNNLLPWFVLLATALVLPAILILRKTRSKPAHQPASQQTR